MKKRRTPAALAVVGTRRLGRRVLLRSTALQGAVALVLAAPAVAQPAPNARPMGGQVVAGAAAISNTASNTQITQSSNRAAIDWHSFNVGSQQSVTFAQPSSSAVTLNRVTAGDPSSIAGKITANGQIILTNPSGVTFYRGAQVNAQSVIVSAAGISNQNFMAGRMVFDQAAKPDARIDNRGTITVKQAGLAALVAPSVSNSGVINARMGQVVLAGATTHTLDMYGDGLVSIDVTKQVTKAPVGPDGKPVTALVTNDGVIRADGGVVQLTAKAADGVVQNLVRAGGVIRADTVGGRAGRIEIAGTGGSVVVEGRVAADGDAPGTVGGQVKIAGSAATTIAAGAHVSANGRAGGGLVAVGTTLARAQGSGAAPAGTSAVTTVAKGARVSANATGNGKGGRVTVLSTQHTSIDGALSARGGKAGGDGGTIEMSGELGFSLTGSADASAPHGAAGTIVLDPRDLTITTTASGTNATTTDNTDPNIGYATNGATTDAYVTPTQLENLHGDVHLQASHDLIVASGFTITTGAVTLDAGRNLTIEASGSISVPGSNLILNAATTDSTGVLSVNGAISAAGIQLSDQSGGIVFAANANSAGEFRIVTKGAVTQTGGIITTGDLFGSASSVSLTQPNAITGIATLGGGFATTAGGLIIASASPLTVGPNANIGGTITVPAGQTLTLMADTMTIQATGHQAIDAPGATVVLQPLSANRAIAISDTTPGAGLGFTTAELGLITAGTLQLGGRGMTGDILLGSTEVTGAAPPPTVIDLVTNGNFPLVRFATTGTVTQSGSLLVNALAGNAGAITLTSAGNSIPSIAGLTSSGAIALTTTGDFTASGTNAATGAFTLNAGGNVTVASGATIGGAGVSLTAASTAVANPNAAASVTVDGKVNSSVDVTLAAGTSGISVPGILDLTSAGGVLRIDTPGPLTQGAASVITADTLEGTAGTVSLLSAGNAIKGVGTTGFFTVTSPTGDFLLTDSIPLQIAESAIDAGISVPNTRTIALRAPSLTIDTSDSGNPTVVALLGTISFTTDLASIANSTRGPTVTTAVDDTHQGSFFLAPLTAGRTVEFGVAPVTTKPTDRLFLDSTDTANIAALTYQIGVLNGGVGTAGDVVLGGIDLLAGSSLTLNASGNVTETGTGLGVTLIKGQAASVDLGGDNFIGTIAGFTTFTGGFALHSSNNLTVTAPITAARGTTELNLSSSANSGGNSISIAADLTGGIVRLDSTNGTPSTAGGINQTAGIITANTMLTGGGNFATLPDANKIGNLSDFTVDNSLLLTTVQALQVTGAVKVKNTYGEVTAQTLTLNAPGITQIAGSTVTALELDGSSNNGLTLSQTTNQIQSVGTFTLTGKNFALTTASPTLSFGTGELNAGAGSVTLVTNGIAAVVSPTVATAILAPTGGVTITPLTATRRIEAINGSAATAGSLSISQAFLNLIDTNTLTLGGGVSSAIHFGNNGETVSLTGHADTLNLLSSGAVTEGTNASLVVGSLTGVTGAVTLAVAGNAVASVGPYTATGAFDLATTGALDVAGLVSSTTVLTLAPTGALTVAAGLTAPTITLSGSSVAQTAGAIDASTALTVTTAGAFTEGGTITAGALSATVGSASLLTATNAIGTLTGGSTGGFALADTGALTIGAAGFDGGAAVTLSSTGAVTVDGRLAATALTVNAGGAFTDGAGVPVIAVSFTGTDASIDLATASIGTLGRVTSTSGVTIANTAPLTVAGPVTDGAFVTLSAAGGMVLSGTITAPTITLSTTDRARPATLGTIQQTGGSLIATNAVTVTASDTLTQTAGTITAGAGSVTLGSMGPMTLGGTVTGGVVTLNAQAKGTAIGTVTQTGGAISATTLDGTAASFSLTQTGNLIGALGTVTANGATPTLVVTDGETLTVSGPVVAGDTTLDVAGALDVTGSLSVAGLALSVTGDATAQTGSAVTVTGVLSGTAGSLHFATPVAVSTLGSFATTAGLDLSTSTRLAVTGTVTDSASVTLASAGPMTLSGTVTAPIIAVSTSDGRGGAGSITQTGGSLTGTTAVSVVASDTLTQSAGTISSGAGTLLLSSAGPLAFGGTVSGGAVTLTAVDKAGTSNIGSITQTGGTLTAATLTGRSDSTTTLTQAGNAVTQLAGFTSTGGFALTDGQGLSVTGAVQDSASVTLNVGGALTLAANVIAPAESLTASGAITQSAGGLQATTLTGSGASVVLGSGTNQVAMLNAFAATPGAFLLTDSTPLSVNGAVSAGTGQTLTIADDATSFTTTGSLTAANGIVVLRAGTPGHAITVGGAGLTGTPPVTANQLTIGNVGDGAITINGPLNGTGVAILDLESGGAVTQSAAGVVSANTLIGQAGSVTLNSDNQIATLGSFGSAGSFSLTDAQTLSITGTVGVGGAATIVSTAGLTSSGTVSAGAITLTAQDGDITQTAGQLGTVGVMTLTAAGAIDQTGGVVLAGTLTGSSGGTTSLTAPGNVVGGLAGFSSVGGFSLSTGGPLAVTGLVSDSTAVTLTTTTGVIALSGSVQTGALTLNGAGGISQPGGSLQAARLTGSAGAAGAAFTSRGNAVDALGPFTSLGDFTLTDSTAVSVTGAVSVPQGHTLTLIDNAPSFATGGSLAAPGGTVALQEYTTGNGITLGGGDGLSGNAPVTAQTLAVGTTAGGPITIAGAFNLANVQVLELLSGGAITETGTGAIRIGTLTGQGASANLGGANQIGTLGRFTTTGAFALTDGPLTVAGPLSASQASLTVTGDLALAGTVTAPGGVSLVATGAITQPGGGISTGTLSGSAASAALGGANSVTTLAGFTTTGGFALTDGPLTVTGPVSASQASLAVTGDLALAGTITAPTGVSLVASGAITQAGGGISTGSLSGSAASADLGGGNSVATLAGFTTTGAFALTDGPLTVAGPLSASQASLSVTGDLAVNGTISAPVSVSLAATGDITESGGISTGSLSGSAASAALNGANSIATLGGFTTTGAFALTDGPLTVTGPVSASQVSLAVTGDLALAGAITAPTGVSLVASGAITEPGGSISTGSLSGSAASADLSGGNSVATLAGFTTTGTFALTDGPLTVAGPLSASQASLTVTGDLAVNGSISAPVSVSLVATGDITEPGSISTGRLSGSAASAAFGGTNSVATLAGFTTTGAFSLTDGPLTVTGPVSASQVSLTVTGDLALAGAITAPGGVSLVASGAITEPGGSVSTGSLSGSAGSADLGGGNSVATLAGFTTTGAFALTDGPLTVTGPLSASQVSLSVTGDLAVDGTITAPAAVSLIATGAITEAGGISTASLSGSAASAALGGTNSIATLAGFTTTGAFALTDGPLTVAGPVSALQASLTVTGDLALAGAITAPGGVSLVASGAITEPGGSVSTGSLSGSAASASLGGSNSIATLAGFTTTGAFSLTDGPLTVTGPVSASQVSLAVTGDLALAGAITAPVGVSLVASGAITEPGGSISTGSLSGSAASADLGGGNSVATLAAFTATGAFALTDGPLTVAGPLSASQASLSVTGDLAVAGTISAPVSVSLAVTGAITEAGGISTGSLSGSAASAALNGTNSIATLAAFTTTGAFSLTDGPLTVTGPVSASQASLTVTGDLALAGAITAPGGVSLVASGAITEPGGSISTGSLSGSAASADLSGGNSVATLAEFTTTGAFALTDGPLTVAGPLSASQASLTVTGDLAVNGTISAPVSVSLVATGDITESGSISTGRLSGSAASAAFGGTNSVATLAGFTTTGAFSLTDGPLTVTGPVSASQASLTVTGDLTLAGAITAPVGVSLVASGAITEPGGSVSTGSLSGSAASASLGGSNSIATLAGFTTTGAFSLTDGPLSVTGPVQASQASLAVTGDLALAGAITAPAGVSLVASGAITEPGGGISTGSLSGSAASADLSGTNSVATLAAFTTTGAFALTDGPLTVTGPLSASQASLTIGGDLAVNGTISAPVSVALSATGAITETGGISTGSLSGGAASVALGGANSIGTLAGFTTTGAFTLTDGPLTVAGPVSASQVSLAVTGDLALAGTITAPNALSLVASGAITQPGGSIITNSLSGSAASADLGSTGNSVVNLAGFTTTGDFTLFDGRSLTVTAPVDPNTVTLDVVGDLTIASSVTGGTVVLIASGGITETGSSGVSINLGGGDGASARVAAGLAPAGGTIVAGTLTGSSGLSTNLTNPGNALGVLGPFTAGGSFLLSDTSSLTVTGPVSASAASLATSGNLILAGNVTGTQALTLLAGLGSISQTGGSITTNQLLGSANTASLGSGGNAIGSLTGFTTVGPFSLVDGTGLSVSGAVSGSSVTLSSAGGLVLGANVTGGSVTLNAGGALTQSAGIIQANSLSGSAGSAALGGANQIGTLASFTTPGTLQVQDATNLGLSGPVQAGTLALTAAGNVTQTGGTLSATNASISAGGAVDLGNGGTASIANLGNVSAGTSFTLADSSALQLNGTVAAPSATITATGSMVLNGGVIQANSATLQVRAGANGTGSLLQTGVTTALPFSIATGSLQLNLPGAAGTLVLDSLLAPRMDVTLGLGTGRAAGTLNVGGLLVLGAGGSANFVGEVGGQTGFGAAQTGRIQPMVSEVYQLNGCAIGAVTCSPETSFIFPQSFLRPDLLTLDVLDLSVTRDRDDPTLLLPNISDRDY